MIFLLDILVSKNELNKLKDANINEALVEWAGITYSQEPIKYHYKLETIFIRHSDMNMEYYKKYIRKNDSVNNYVCIYLKSDVLMKLRNTLYNNDFDNYKSELIFLIRDLYRVLNKFYIILLRDEEIIDKYTAIDNPEDAVEMLLNSLDWENPKGVVISKG